MESWTTLGFVRSVRGRWSFRGREDGLSFSWSPPRHSSRYLCHRYRTTSVRSFRGRMEQILLLAALGLSAPSSAQRSVQVAFNLLNCEAHSRQVKALGSIEPSVTKTLFLNKQDSAVTPWIRDRFELNGVLNLHFAYVPSARLNRMFSSRGGSLVYVLDGADTAGIFPLEELIDRIAWINQGAGAEGARTGASKRSDAPIGTGARTPMREGHGMSYVIKPLEGAGVQTSSDVAVVADAQAIWIMDRFLGNLHRIDLQQPPTRMRTIGSIKDLLMEAIRNDSGFSRFQAADLAVYAEEMVLPEPEKDRITLLLECRDTTGGTNAFPHCALTIAHDRPVQVEMIDMEPRADGLTPALGSSGFTFVEGGDIVAQVLRMWDDGRSYPLFGRFSTGNGIIRLEQVEPYDYRTSRWRSVPAFNFVNGMFSGGLFAYAITPVLVDPVEGKEFDVAEQLGLSSDSAILLAPGYYGTIDLRSDPSGVTLLHLAKDDVHLARFVRRPDGLDRVWVDVLDRRYIGSRSMRLIDPRTVAILSGDGALVIARSSQE